MNIDGQVTLNNFTKKDKTHFGHVVQEIRPELPVGWRTVEVRKVVKEFQSGFACSKKYAKESGIPHLRPNNIGFHGELDFSKLVFLPAEMVDLSKYSLKEGDVLFNNTNSRELVGRASLITQNLECGFSNHITRLRVDKELITSEWLVHSINHLWLKGHFLRLCRKWIGQAGVNTKMLKSTMIPLPPVDVQRRIVARIEEITSRIEQAKKLREEALKDTEAIMQSELHQIFSRAEEKGWDSKQLEEVAQINRESRNPSAVAPDKEFTYIDISSIESGTGGIVQVKRILGREAPSRARRVIHYNDVLMSTVRPYLKSFAIVPKEYDNQICSTGFAVLTSKESLLPKYLLYYLFSDTVINQCNSMMIGAHYPALNQKQVAKIKIAVPSIEEQNRIIRYLDSINEKNQKLRKHQEKTKKEIEAITQAVLRKAFIGQL